MEKQNYVFHAARNILLTILLYGLFLYGLDILLPITVPFLAWWMLPLLVISPIAPIAFILLAIVDLLKHTDEFQQRLQVHAMLFLLQRRHC